MSAERYKIGPHGVDHDTIGFVLDVDSYTSMYVLRLALGESHMAYQTKWGATAWICIAFNPNGILMKHYFNKTLPEHYSNVSRGRPVN